MHKKARTMDKDEAVAFIENMRWFSGFGSILTKAAPNDKVVVTASVAAWSNWVSV